MAATVLALAAAACGGADDGAVSSAPTVVTAPGATTSTTTSAASSPSDTVVEGNPAGSTATTAAVEPPPTTAPPQPGIRPPAAGTYRFHLVGTTNGDRVDRESITQIERLDDNRVRVVSADGEQTLVQRFESEQVGLELVEIFAAGVRRRFVADPPVTYLALPADAGRTWSWEVRSDTGTRIRHTSTVRGRETIPVLGTPTEVVVVDTRLDVSGDVNGTIELTTWFDPARSVSVRTREVARFGILLTSDTTADLTAVEPA